MTAEDEDLRFQEHMQWLGHVAAMWSSLELQINMAIWELANIERWIAARRGLKSNCWGAVALRVLHTARPRTSGSGGARMDGAHLAQV